MSLKSYTENIAKQTAFSVADQYLAYLSQQSDTQNFTGGTVTDKNGVVVTVQLAGGVSTTVTMGFQDRLVGSTISAIGGRGF